MKVYTENFNLCSCSCDSNCVKWTEQQFKITHKNTRTFFCITK